MAPSIIPKKKDTYSSPPISPKKTETLSVGDGFRFGCGFFIAAMIYSFVMMTVFIVAAILLTTGGISAIVP